MKTSTPPGRRSNGCRDSTPVRFFDSKGKDKPKARYLTAEKKADHEYYKSIICVDIIALNAW